MKTINLEQKLSAIDDHWNPRILVELNGQDVRVAKIQGTFDWHSHEQEDELFLVLHGRMEMQFRDHTEMVEEGEMILVPRGVEHRPHADEETAILLFEPSSTINTGNIESERTRRELARI